MFESHSLNNTKTNRLSTIYPLSTLLYTEKKLKKKYKNMTKFTSQSLDFCRRIRI